MVLLFLSTEFSMSSPSAHVADETVYRIFNDMRGYGSMGASGNR